MSALGKTSEKRIMASKLRRYSHSTPFTPALCSRANVTRETNKLRATKVLGEKCVLTPDQAWHLYVWQAGLRDRGMEQKNAWSSVLYAENGCSNTALNSIKDAFRKNHGGNRRDNDEAKTSRVQTNCAT